MVLDQTDFHNTTVPNIQTLVLVSSCLEMK